MQAYRQVLNVSDNSYKLLYRIIMLRQSAISCGDQIYSGLNQTDACSHTLYTGQSMA